MTITALIVTFNRRALLERCLSALASQSRPPDRLLVVDNASTDGTQQWLEDWTQQVDGADCVCLEYNMGGAGGFAEGMKAAVELGSDWIWMMDDDAEPHTDALHHLMAVEHNVGNIYGSLAVDGDDVAWPTILLDGNSRTENKTQNIPTISPVYSLPFLGYMIHTSLINRIGLPDIDLFIGADDFEYNQRARRSGAEIILVSKSRIEHPKSKRYEVHLPGRKLSCLSLPPWKRYYDTRNRILIAYEHFGVGALITQAIPGSLVRLVVSIRYEPQKMAQFWAFWTGFFDGLFKRKGKRHQRWHLK